jgi:integrase
MRDVDLDNRTLFIAETKFYKSRWVPVAVELAGIIGDFRRDRVVVTAGRARPDDAFFITSWRRPYSYARASQVFHRILRSARIRLCDPSSPRLFHALRHTFACRRLLAWYRDGDDVEAKLPLLATYMGHVDVSSTEVYLTATTLLLREAHTRFEADYGSIIQDRSGPRDD